MPIYEYRCLACGKGFSKLARHVTTDDAPAPVCPQCGGNSGRTLSSFAYHRSLQMQIEQIDPRIERELDAVDTLRDDPLDRLNLNFPASRPE